MELEQNGNYEKGYFNGISDILIVDDCLWAVSYTHLTLPTNSLV